MDPLKRAVLEGRPMSSEEYLQHLRASIISRKVSEGPDGETIVEVDPEKIALAETVISDAMARIEARAAEVAEGETISAPEPPPSQEGVGRPIVYSHPGLGDLRGILEARLVDGRSQLTIELPGPPLPGKSEFQIYGPSTKSVVRCPDNMWTFA